MDYSIRFVHPGVLLVLIPALIGAALFVYLFKKRVVYSYSLGSYIRAQLESQNGAVEHPYQKVLYILRFVILLLLALLVAHPQLVDYRSQVQIDGIDIVLALDVSGSMDQRDSQDDPRSRVDIAKKEAADFVEKRVNDAVALVIFGNDVLSRCPLTQDKKLLIDMIKELKIGIVDPDGTKLATAVITAAGRLKNSQAASKIIILLTDGEPSEGDMDTELAIKVARELGVKIYTIGIGGDEARIIFHPFYGPVQQNPVNSDLLKKIAHSAGGQFFMAKNAKDMRTIYQAIDKLETTKHETIIFNNYYEWGIYGMYIALALVCCEILLSTFVWFSL
jgi:Ca-activated chloride channel family protein